MRFSYYFLHSNQLKKNNIISRLTRLVFLQYVEKLEIQKLLLLTSLLCIFSKETRTCNTEVENSRVSTFAM